MTAAWPSAAPNRTCVRPCRPSGVLVITEKREPASYTPEFSAGTRGVEVWAALLSLGRSGLADLIERDCRLAEQFAERLAAAGFQIWNDVCLNQVLVSFGDEAQTKKVIAEVQQRWDGLVRWHRMAGAYSHAHQRIGLGNVGRRCGSQPGGDPESGRRCLNSHSQGLLAQPRSFL